MSVKRKCLSLSEKVEILKIYDEEKLSARALSERFKEKFSAGKTQIAEVIRKKDEILEAWSKNCCDEQKRVKVRKTSSMAVNEAVYAWICAVRNKNVPISGPLIQKTSLEVSTQLNITDFKASNGWLEKFRQRYSISFKTACGESSDVNSETVSEWSKRLPTLCSAYKPSDIFNLDETGLYYRIMPNKTMCLKTEKCVSGKKSKERLTVMLCVNMIGEFEKPLIIGKAKKPIGALRILI